MDDVVAFYDALAGDYDALFENWDASVDRQSELIDRIIRTALPERNRTVLDATCGIGARRLASHVAGITSRRTT